MTKPIDRDPLYRKRAFDAAIIELCVRWYISYRRSYRDLVEQDAPVARAAAAPTPRKTLNVNEARGSVAVAKTGASQNFTCPTTQRHRGRAEWAP